MFEFSSALAHRADVLHNALHARLALIDPAQNLDKYYILQVLVVKDNVIDKDDEAEDTDAKNPRRLTRNASRKKTKTKKEYHLFSRWARTDTSGQGKVEGPFANEIKVKQEFAKIFESMTGVDWKRAIPGSHLQAGKYECLLSTTSPKDSTAGWFYYLEK